jgi:WD40 repeat protein
VAAVAAAAKADANIAIGRQALAQAQILPFDSATSIFQRGLLKVEGLQRAPGLEAVGVAQQASSILGRPVVKMVHDSFVSAVAFSPDGTRVVSGSLDGTARVWNAGYVLAGDEVARMPHEGGVCAVALSPDGRWVISGSADGTARVWEAESGIERFSLQHTAAVTSVAFSPDGRWIVTGSDDGTARVWAWQPQDVITLLCARLPRNFTKSEWQQFFGDVPYHPTCENLPAGK